MPPHNQNDLLVKKWSEWISFRKELKKPYKTQKGESAAYNWLLDLCDHNSETGVAIINQSIEHEWLDFYALKTRQITKLLPGETKIQQMLREMREREKLEENGNKQP